MKKFFYSILAVTTMLLAATSCSNEEDVIEVGYDGKAQKVTFKVELPGETASRAIADGVEVAQANMANKLAWALYETGKEDNLLDTGTATKEKDGKEFTVDIDMVKGLSYKILFLAYNEGGTIFDVTEGDDLKSLNYKSAVVSNAEAYDAFVACHSYNTLGGSSNEVHLKRPFAQINAATTGDDLAKADKLDAVVTNSQLVIEKVPTQYNVMTGEVSEYKDVTYTKNAILYQTGTTTNEILKDVDGVDYNYLNMVYVLAGEGTSTSSNHDATFTFYRDADPQLVRTLDIVNLPIQRNYRTNVVGNLITQTESFKVIIDAEFDGDYIYDIDEEKNVVTNQDLEAALKQDLETIIINLGEETTSRGEGEKLTFDVKIGAWTEMYYFGSAKTKTIIINGNGHTINFVHENTDWNYIRCVNDDAKWYISNANLTNSGENNGPWNRHDIRFYNAVELENVTSDKAIAALNDATLKNVKIEETGAVYGFWISAQGQTVKVDGLEINSERGIKIADEYVDTPELVTLKVDNAKFATQKKAAVLVTSTAGAKITWGEGNDISGVEADKVNAVWVDEDRADAYDLVTVIGCTKLLEGDEFIADGLTKSKNGAYNISNSNGLAKLNEMMADKSAGRDAVVNLTADINFTGKTWTPVDSHADTQFTFKELNGNGHTISNLTIDGQAMFKRFAGSGDVTIKDVTFDNATVNSTAINTSILTVQSYQNVLLDNVDVKNSSITGGYKVAPLIATVYNESSTTITATLKNCDVENVTVKATSYDFCTAGMVAFVYAGDNDKIEFENCSVKNVKLIAPDDTYKAHAAIYTTGSGSLYNESEGVTVTNVTFETLN